MDLYIFQCQMSRRVLQHRSTVELLVCLGIGVFFVTEFDFLEQAVVWRLVLDHVKPIWLLTDARHYDDWVQAV